MGMRIGEITGGLMGWFSGQEVTGNAFYVYVKCKSEVFKRRLLVRCFLRQDFDCFSFISSQNRCFFSFLSYSLSLAPSLFFGREHET